MRRVWTTYGMLPLVLLIAASLVFISRGTNQVEASPFAPTLTTTLGSAAPATDANVTTSLSFGTFPSPTRNFPNNFPAFTPADWGMYLANPTDTVAVPTDGIPLGTTTGSLTSITTLGFLNSACAGTAAPAFPALQDSSTDSSAGNTIAVTAAFASLNADVNPANGVKDGVEHWHTLLSALGLPQTRERQAASAIVVGTPVWLDILTFDPGAIAPAALGFATLVIIENFNPAAPAAPSLITDTCGVSAITTQLGTVGGFPHRTNPAAPGQKLFFLSSGSDRDADQGPAVATEPFLLAPSPPLPPNVIGFVNDDDTCPYNPNFGSTYQPVSPFNGDSTESPGDGIDLVCDATPGLSGCGMTPPFPSDDCDGDAYLNRQDNCPQFANGVATNNQADTTDILAGPPADGGPINDDIGDDCDLNPGVADGHFHNRLNVSAQCIGAPDSDGDGYCDGTEFVLGSNPASGASRPEALAIPTTCSDGADNDGDAATDLADTGCQLPAHDLSIKKVNGAALACSPSNTVDYVAILNNNQAVDENGEISIVLDSQPGGTLPPAAGKSAGSVTSVGGATVTASGPINIDGDIDVEWLTRATVSVKSAPASTTVHFDVTYPACSGGPNVTAVDYTVSVDLCHADDIAPLGVNPLNGACAGGASDGGQDANSGNDGVVTRNVDDITK